MTYITRILTVAIVTLVVAAPVASTSTQVSAPEYTASSSVR